MDSLRLVVGSITSRIVKGLQALCSAPGAVYTLFIIISDSI